MSAAEDLIARGHEIAWLVSPRADSLLPKAVRTGPVLTLGSSRDSNLATWRRIVEDVAPQAVVFADYPLFFLSGTASPLWERESESEFIGPLADHACVATFDHVGLGQLHDSMRLGPAPFTERLEPHPLPPEMRILLPCPLHEPDHVPARRGTTCRSRTLGRPLEEDERHAVRELFCHEDPAHRVVLHAVPAWACQLARMLRSDFYVELGRRLVEVLPEHSTIVSINDGSLLPASTRCGVNVINRAATSPDAVDALLQSADLFVTDNPVSSLLGRAVASGTPAAVLKLWAPEDSGGDYDVFPIFPRGEVQKLCLWRANSLIRCFFEVNLGDIVGTKRAIEQLVMQSSLRLAMAASQDRYNAAVCALPTAGEAILATAQC